ncbi:HAD family hydrolase [Elioraea sp.]|uniref:HAD family hydrolase n=1 Tax=Elioraea sp. TaxID=2185103 RepID=UPI00307F21D7
MLDLHRYRALTFDCYGTLIDWERGILAFVEPWLAARGAPHEPERILATFSEVETVRQQEDPAAPYPVILERCFHDICARLGVPSDSASARAFGASVGDWPPFPDTPAAMAMFHGRFVTGIVSNVDDASLARSIAAIGTAPDFTVTAQQIRSYKPARPHFDRMLEVLAGRGIGRHEVLHVAQSLFHDIAPCRALGIACCWVNRHAHRGGQGATPEAHAVPDHSVTSLAELVALARIQTD